MALETGTYISDLVVTNPAGTDTLDKADDHLRLIKATVKNTFPNITGAVTPTHTDLNKLTSSGSPQFASIELGAASDTTITRSAAGVIAVEGGVVPKENRANFFTASQIIETTDTGPALRVTQLGTGAAIRVEDETSPDSSPFIVTAAGDVGIGVSSPTGKLEVSSTNQYAGISLSGTGRIWQVGSNSTALVTMNFQHDALAFTNYGVERMRIDASGNVGIGKTAAAGIRLDVNGSVAATNYRVDNAYPNFQWYPSTGTANQRSFRIQVDTGNFSIIGQDDSGTQQNFPFQIAWGGGITFSNSALVKSSGFGIGYGTGSGGTVTQATSKSTGVTLNKTNGQITMNNAALAASTTAIFVATNSTCTSTDTVIVNVSGGVTGAQNYNVWALPNAGSINFYVRNISGASLSEAVVLNFSVIKGATS